jgi:DNA-binding beta-propeller fold protein YncE
MPFHTMRHGVIGLALLIGSQSASSSRATLVVQGGLNEPFGVAFAANGNAYIVEMGGNRVSELDGAGHLRVVAGTGVAGLSGDGGPASQATFNNPHHLAFGPDGRLYVADTQNFCVRAIDLTTGVITRVAGTGVKGFAGDGGPAAEAQFGGIFAIAFRGSLLYLCDLGNRRVRVVDLTSGIVKTVAGNGEKGVPADGQPALEQPLVDPRAVAVDANGDLYVLEREGHALRVVRADGQIHTVAGTGAPGFSGDGGPARSAELRGPKHISIDDNDQSVLISDTENHVIRRYSPVDGTISRVAGSGMLGSGGLDGPADHCELNRPHGAQVRPHSRAIYISDSENHRIIKVAPDEPSR